MNTIIKVSVILIFVFSSSYVHALELTLQPKTGISLTYWKKGEEFKAERANYNYTYDIVIEKNNCSISAIPEGMNIKIPFRCTVLKNIENFIVLSKDPVKNDPYQEFYFLCPKLNIGFMVIGKANDGFKENIPNFPNASLSTIPLTIATKRTKSNN